MSRISCCASCHGDILIPSHALPQDQMRCPLCGAQFQVQDVLATSILAPPEAILVPRSPIGMTGVIGSRPSRSEEPAEVEAEPITTPPRRKKQPGVLSHLIGIVGGGLIGLSLGYVGLLRFGGPRYDFLEVADKLPHWVTAPINLTFLNGWGKDAKEPVNGRGLKALLDEADSAPTVEMPNAPPHVPDSIISPFEDSGTAPPFVPQAPPPGDTDAESNAPPPPAEQSIPPSEPAAAPPPMAESPGNIPQPAQSGPNHFTAYSAEDLSLATADMAGALRCPACDGVGFVKAGTTQPRDGRGAKAEQVADRRVPCHVCGGKPSAKMTPELYARLCHFAEVVTFVSKGDTNTWNQRDSVQQLLANVGADPKSAESIGRLAGFQLDPTRHSNSGIALAGTVQETSQVGSLYAMKVVLFGLPKVVTVVSWRPAQPAINIHDRVIILGSIVDNPTENLAGYEGRLDQVVWGGLPAKLPPQP